MRFSPRSIFRSLRRASPDVDYPARPRPGRKRRGPRIFLRRRRLRDRPRVREQSSWSEILAALALGAAALGWLARNYAGSVSGPGAVLPVPVALVALFGIWHSKLAAAKKILWSIPAVAFVIPFLPV